MLRDLGVTVMGQERRLWRSLMLLLPLLTGRGHVGEMWKLEVCFCLQPAAGLQRCCSSFMYHCWLQCCKCSKKWIFDQEGPGSQTWVPCVKDFNCCHEGGPAQFCRQCAAKMSLDNEIVAGKLRLKEPPTAMTAG